MSNFKNEHTSGNTLWRKLKGFFLGKLCDSYIVYSREEKWTCNQNMGHNGKHTHRTVAWAYGDNWLEH